MDPRIAETRFVEHCIGEHAVDESRRKNVRNAVVGRLAGLRMPFLRRPGTQVEPLRRINVDVDCFDILDGDPRLQLQRGEDGALSVVFA